MGDVDHYFCGDCIHQKSWKGKKFCPCKRLDHDKIKFAIPWFCTYDANQHRGVICSDFYPRHDEHWPGFPAYWEGYVEQWLPYGNTNILMYFCLNGDTSVRYGVPLMDFVNGTMLEGDTLKAVEREYYKRSRRSPTGYELIHEPISGIQVAGWVLPSQSETAVDQTRSKPVPKDAEDTT